MNRYQLATIVKWAETLRTRKRLQKVVYLLQAAGCDFGAEYALHHYGPYSSDVACLTDEMVQAGLLSEDEEPNQVGTSFSYQLSESAKQQMEKLEQRGDHAQRLGALLNHELLAKRLLTEPELRELEFAATIAYFHAKEPEGVSDTWELAREAAAKFKRQDASSTVMQSAERLAREIVNSGEHG